MRELNVHLEGREAATLNQDNYGAIKLEYLDTYLSIPDATPLSVSMPPVLPSHGNKVASIWISNLLPEDPRVLQRWAQDFKVSATSPFRLLEHVGGEIAGAARLLKPGVNPEEGGIEWLSTNDVAIILNQLALDPSAWSPRQMKGQFSLAGVQAKTALRLEGDRWGRPFGSEPTTHILKVSSTFEHQTLNEHLCMRAASKLKNIVVARTHVEQFGVATAIIIERYDRRIDKEKVVRIHQEDMCQALKVNPFDKYQQDGGPGIKEIFALLRRVVTPERVTGEVERFLRAIAFSWVIASTDGHAKNYSVLLSGSQVRLAPMYDVQSALPYLTKERIGVPEGQMSERSAEFAMRIGTHFHIDSINREDWELVADQSRCDRENVLEIVREVTVNVPAAFYQVAEEVRTQGLLTDDQLKFVANLEKLVERRAEKCLEILGRR